MNTPEEIAEELIKGNSVFLTGAAGTGKSWTVNKIVEIFKEKEREVITTSTTAASALHVNGVTTHKAFRLAISNNLSELKAYDNNSISTLAKLMHTKDWAKAEKKFLGNLASNFTGIDLIVIDEVSMLSADILNLVFYRLSQLNLKIPILFVGDFLQLPPVSKSKKVRYAFEHKYWSMIKPVYLTENKRSEEIRFTELLHRIRMGIIVKEDIDLLRSKVIDYIPNPESTTVLTSLKRQSEAINQEQFDQLNTPIIRVRGMFMKGRKPVPTGYERDKFLNDVNTKDVLILRKDALVSCTVNVPETPLINGTLGKIVEWEIDGEEDSNGEYDIKQIKRITIKEAKTLKLLDIEPYKFSQNSIATIDGVARIVPDFHYLQIPVQLAWACTIHKAQGATLPGVHVMCKGMFEVGQFYVSISRTHYLDSLSLQDFNPAHIKTSELAVQYYKALEHLCRKN